MKFYDIHGHINSSPLWENVPEIVDQMRKENVILNCVGYDFDSSIKAVKLAQKYPDCIWATVAIHPNSVQHFDLNEVEKQFASIIEKYKKEIVAIGECGLDKHYSLEYVDLQLEWLKMHALLAKKYHLPLMLHIRDAHREAINFLSENRWIKEPIIIHCFSQNCDVFYKYEETNLNLYYSIPGIVTFPKTVELSEVVGKIPIEKILVETDCPWLAPCPNRGKTNYPFYVKYVVQKIAELKNIPVDILSEQIFNNSIKIFKPKR